MKAEWHECTDAVHVFFGGMTTLCGKEYEKALACGTEEMRRDFMSKNKCGKCREIVRRLYKEVLR